MLQLVLVQLAVTLAVSAVSGFVGGVSAMISAALGGLCCVVPNALFALRMFSDMNKPGGANPASFFIGEFVKIGLTVALLFAIGKWYQDLSWLALLVGFVAALKSYIILLFRH